MGDDADKWGGTIADIREEGAMASAKEVERRGRVRRRRWGGEDECGRREEEGVGRSDLWAPLKW